MIVKICGITRMGDARHAVAQGADALGFVFWRGSPRCITPAAARGIVRALPGHVRAVGVFVDADPREIGAVIAETGIDIIQLHGDAPPALGEALPVPVWRACASAAEADRWPAAVTILLDAHDPVRRGGTGRPADRVQAAALAARRPLILAGGLTPENVSAAIAEVQPLGVDVSSGVESAPGIKDPDRVARFLAAAHAGCHAAQQ